MLGDCWYLADYIQTWEPLQCFDRNDIQSIKTLLQQSPEVLFGGLGVGDMVLVGSFAENRPVKQKIKVVPSM